VWRFARASYFAFYAIEHYIDPGYRFAGLPSFAWYILGRRTASAESTSPASANAGPTEPPEE
jgi:hypothetical protein